MRKTLTKHGNSLALVIDKPILDLLKITADTPLEISTDGRSLVVSPSNDKRRAKFDRAVAKVHREWGDVLRKLAE